LDQIADVGDNVSMYLKIFVREIIFEVFQPGKKHTWTSQKDRLSQMDRQMTYCGIIALCIASHN